MQSLSFKQFGCGTTAEGHLDLCGLAMHHWNNPDHTPPWLFVFCRTGSEPFPILTCCITYSIIIEARIWVSHQLSLLFQGMSLCLCPQCWAASGKTDSVANAITSSQHSCTFQSNGERGCALLGFCTKTQHFSSICKIIALMTHSQPC